MAEKDRHDKGVVNVSPLFQRGVRGDLRTWRSLFFLILIFMFAAKPAYPSNEMRMYRVISSIENGTEQPVTKKIERKVDRRTGSIITWQDLTRGQWNYTGQKKLTIEEEGCCPIELTFNFNERENIKISSDVLKKIELTSEKASSKCLETETKKEVSILVDGALLLNESKDTIVAGKLNFKREISLPLWLILSGERSNISEFESAWVNLP